MTSEFTSWIQKQLHPPRSLIAAPFLGLLTWLLMNRLMPGAPDELLWAWAFLLAITLVIFGWLERSKILLGTVLSVYLVFSAFSLALAVGWIGHRMPLAVQLDHAPEYFVEDMATDAGLRAAGLNTDDYRFEPYFMYASRPYIITNDTDSPVTFQALLKAEGRFEDGLIMALAVGRGERIEVMNRFSALLRDDHGILLSPVTVGPRAVVRGRFLFDISNPQHPEVWIAALSRNKPLDGVAYIDLREHGNGGPRLAEPLYLTAKQKAISDVNR